MSGFELFQCLLDHPQWSRIPLLFLTAKASPEDVTYTKEMGIDDYIIKPFCEIDLLKRISKEKVRKRKLYPQMVVKCILSCSIEIITN